MDLNYFVCTLGQAALPGIERPFRNVNHLIDFQSEHHPDHPAVGLTTPSNESASQWRNQIYTFRDIERGSKAVAEALLRDTSIRLQDGRQTVALLCPSSVEFLFLWLALMRLGHAVLLIAPQCSPSAVSELCKGCSATVLFYDRIYQDLAEKSQTRSTDAATATIALHDLAFLEGQNVSELIQKPRTPSDNLKWPEVQPSDIAYLHHTSGTSTGIPKPIPQSHRAAVGVLPSLNGSQIASFTTTPLYHGGIADLFRAWSSTALIWLFPGKDVPITAANVVKCLDSISSMSTLPPVKYFSSVPYVLQILAEDGTGLDYLQAIDIVGVGGAALPDEVGSELVNKGVNLISRFGSAECGFLMSSHRDYTKDREWQFLRPDEKVKLISFEEREGGLSELVVLPDWPHMAKRNRDDGSFATSDLFQPHPTIKNTWRYHSRADSQLTLITGKKFDPAPLESAISASSPLLADTLIYGNGQPYPGILLFRSANASTTSDAEIIRQVWPVIEKLNRESQGHAKISQNMLVCMPFQETSLEKSSKGTILRGKAEERYRSQIEGAYKQTATSKRDVSDQELGKEILNIVQSSLHNSDGTVKLDPDEDLFSHGVDSIASIQIRNALIPLLPANSPKLPMTIVQDCGTVSRLHESILHLRQGRTLQKSDDDLQLMQDLVRKYGTFQTQNTTVNNVLAQQGGRDLHVLLTGPTGSLGSHILHQLLTHPSVTHITLLVRGATPHAARERVTKALYTRLLTLPSDFDKRVTVYPCKLNDSQLGLSPSDYQSLAQKVDVIYHLAWSVNFLLPLRSFAVNDLSSLHNLLNFAISAAGIQGRQAPKFIFCSSVASVIEHPIIQRGNTTQSTYQEIAIPEAVLPDQPQAASPLGYARSKWVAECMCFAANQLPALKGKIAIARVGQLSGATDTGIWSKSEAYPLILAAANRVRMIPDLGPDELVDWIPVNIAARGFVDLLKLEVAVSGGNAIQSDAVQSNTTSLSPRTNTAPKDMPLGYANPTIQNPASSNLTASATSQHQPQVYHVISPIHQIQPLNSISTPHNTNTTSNTTDISPPPLSPQSTPEVTTWSELTHLLPLSITPISNWLDTISRDLPSDHPSLKLVEFWRQVYCSGDSNTPSTTEALGTGQSIVKYDTLQTKKHMPSLGLDFGPRVKGTLTRKTESGKLSSVAEEDVPEVAGPDSKRNPGWDIDDQYIKRVFDWCKDNI